MDSHPRYDDLPVSPGKPPGSAWGLWGDDDQLGTLNLLTAERVREGLAAARAGQVFSLNWDLQKPDPPLFGREPLSQTIVAMNAHAFDDYYDRFYPQQSSQWDAFSHVGHPDHGHYNGATAADFTGRPGAKDGIDAWARAGIAGRGVLLDMPRYFQAIRRSYDPGSKLELTVEDFEGAAEAQGLEFHPGDILLIRTGWIEWYERQADEVRRELAAPDSERLQIAGLSGGRDMVRFLWDRQFAAVATDNPTFEAWPRAMIVGDYLHFELLGLLGMPIGELFLLDALAEQCARDGGYDFLFTSAPLNKIGGIGSPPNALAIK
jgi:kynurenine formamidase